MTVRCNGMLGRALVLWCPPPMSLDGGWRRGDASANREVLKWPEEAKGAGRHCVTLLSGTGDERGHEGLPVALSGLRRGVEWDAHARLFQRRPVEKAKKISEASPLAQPPRRDVARGFLGRI